MDMQQAKACRPGQYKRRLQNEPTPKAGASLTQQELVTTTTGSPFWRMPSFLPRQAICCMPLTLLRNCTTANEAGRGGAGRGKARAYLRRARKQRFGGLGPRLGARGGRFCTGARNQTPHLQGGERVKQSDTTGGRRSNEGTDADHRGPPGSASSSGPG